jgi:hypothetical protein
MSACVRSIRQLFPNLDKHEQTQLLCELTSFVSQASKSTLGVNMLDNYNHRTVQVYECVSRHSRVNNLVINPKRNGKDAWCDRFRNIEIKTSKDKYPRFLFDKQNNEIRRQQFFDYDAFVFATFEDELMTRCIFVQEPESIQLIQSLIAIKQSTFIEKEKRNRENGKRGYDTINITMNDITSVNHEVYTPDSGWNYYLKN